MNGRPKSFLATLAIGAIALGGLATGCELIASVDRSQIPGEDGGISGTGGAGGTSSAGGSGGTTAAGGMGGMGGMGGHAGQGGQGGASCEPACGVPDVPDCETIKCVDGKCESTFQPSGTKLPNAKQADGDCKVKVCDGAGKVVEENDDNDRLIDSNDCTNDTCTAGVPKNEPVAVGTACMSNGGTVCDGNGACLECNQESDCKEPSKPHCSANKCVPATCNDGTKNGDETDKDCGGSCNGCGTGFTCAVAGDCISKNCKNLACAVPACDDGIQNGAETEVDCGGGCKGCGPTQKCAVDADCAGKACDQGTKTCTPNCLDAVKNGSETDVDCGGGSCGKCAEAKLCTVGGDCSSNGCCAGTCSACCNNVKDGSETDLDCGGSCDAKCADNGSCVANSDCTSKLCQNFSCKPSNCSNGVKDADEADVDCGGSCQPCTGGKVCGKAGDCASGFCTDGVCCNVVCNGLCEACTKAKTGLADGACIAVSIGTDPDSECAQDVASSCKQNGFCDGARVCQKYDSATVCVTASCTANVQTNESKCDGKGVCAAAVTAPCSPYVCGANACKKVCANDVECIAADYCDTPGANGVCKTKLTQGGACAANNQCASNACVDGFCCDKACNGACEACSAAKSGGTNGTCAPVQAGQDPDSECADQGAASCGTNGVCNGAGACAKYAANTVCVAPSCAIGTASAASLCNGTGACVAGAQTPCAPYVCGANACKANCAADVDCVAADYCDTPGANGVCKTKLSQGGACAANSQCASNACVDGFCCDKACNGACEACSAAKTGGTNGTCAPVQAGQDPDNECADQGAASCGTNGVCNGANACAKYAAATVCAQPSCSTGTASAASLCNGTGTCVAGSQTQCAPYICGAAACNATCANDGECIATDWCNVAVCTLKLDPGATCTANSQCKSGACPDSDAGQKVCN